MTLLAAPAQLPLLLREPPWAGGARAVEPPRIELPPLQHAPRFTWSEEQRERVRREAASQLPGTRPLSPDAQERLFERLGLGIEARARLRSGGALTAGDIAAPTPARAVGLYELLGLPDAQALALWNSVDTGRWSPEQDATLSMLLVRHGDAAAATLIAYAQRRPVQGLRVARWLDAPALAALALKVRRGLKFARGVATDWLLGHPDTAAGVLLRQLLGADAAAREDARAALHVLANIGLRSALENAARACGDAALRALREQLGADPLLRLPERLPRLPAFFDPAQLHRPRLRSDGAALPDEAMQHLGTMLAVSRPEQPYAGLDLVRDACTEASLAAFAWDLFEAWWAAGAPSKQAWAFATALGLFHDDTTAHRLGARALRWEQEGLKQRAVDAIELLAGFGSDAALMHLDHLSTRCKKPWVRDRAAAKLDAVAQARNLSRIELADRLVPMLGLDQSRTLDFGTRRFTIGLDETLAPYIVDADGARLKDLPKPRRSDDAALADAAVLRFKQLKKELRTIARVQVARLEQAMVMQRHWSQDEFRALFVEHPLTRALSARLLWTARDARGDMLGAARIAEDGTLADADDAYLRAADRGALVHRPPAALVRCAARRVRAPVRRLRDPAAVPATRARDVRADAGRGDRCAHPARRRARRRHRRRDRPVRPRLGARSGRRRRHDRPMRAPIRPVRRPRRAAAGARPAGRAAADVPAPDAGRVVAARWRRPAAGRRRPRPRAVQRSAA
jgi:hypothetical protein